MLPGLEDTFCTQLQADNAAVHQPAAECARKAKGVSGKAGGSVGREGEKEGGGRKGRGVRRGLKDQEEQKSCEHVRSWVALAGCAGWGWRVETFRYFTLKWFLKENRRLRPGVRQDP